jgi:hypothetical protein
VTFTPTGNVAATNVQSAIAEVDSEKIGEAPIDGTAYSRKNAAWAAIGAAASDITFIPGGTVGSSNLQAAIEELDAEKLAKAGGTMTGDLIVTKAGPTLVVNKTAVTSHPTVRGQKDGLDRWAISLGHGVIEPGANVGSDFVIYRYDDAGAFVGDVLVIQRSSAVVSGSSIATAAEYRANSAAKILTQTAVWAAAVFVVIADAATFNIDFSTGLDFAMWPSVAGRNIANPTNGKQGQKGLFIINNNGVGTVNWGTSYKFPGGIKPTLTAVNGAIDVVSYTVWDDNIVLCTFAADFK